MRMPNLNALRMFDAAARHLNFRLAAEDLNLTQGAVAQQVRKLEADLGQRLFHRQARGLALTEAGRSYAKPVRQALELIEDATRQLQPTARRVTISVPPSFATKWLVPRMADFAGDCPDIDLRVLADQGLADFTTDGVDLAVRQGALPKGGPMTVQQLAPYRLCAVCNTAQAATLGPDPTPAQLTQATLIQDSHRHWDGLVPDRAAGARQLQFNQTALALDAARNGQGIALIPDLYLGLPGAADGLVRLFDVPQQEGSGFYLVSRPTRGRDTAVTEVARWISGRVGSGP